MKASSFLLFLLSMLLSVMATAGSPVLTEETTQIAIDEYVSYLEDPAGDLTVHQFLAKEQSLQENHSRVFTRGYSESIWWLKVKLTNESERTRWLLEVAYSPLDHLDIYLFKGDRQVDHFTLGDQQDFSERPILHRNYVVPVPIEENSVTDIVIRIETSSSTKLNARLWSEKAFEQHKLEDALIQGMYFGALGIIAAYNLLMGFALRDRIYLYYVGYVVAVGFFVATLNGWAFQYLWQRSIVWNSQAIVVLISLVIFFAASFSRKFLDVPTLSRPLDILIQAVIWISVAIGVSSFWIPYGILIQIMAPLAALACVVALLIGVFGLINGRSAARYYCIAWVVFLVGGVALALSNIGLLPSNAFTDNAAQVGSLIEIVLLSFALAERINQERNLRYEAQKKALELQANHTHELEKQVRERTESLEQAYAKLEALSVTDQLTGLKNRRYLDQTLEHETGRSARNQLPMAVMLLDVDHFKHVNDQYGHLVGDDCLRAIAQRLSKEVCRPTDVVARYGGEEFCVILPETPHAGAQVVAERIRRSIGDRPLETRIGPLAVTVSVGVCVQVPERENDVTRFLTDADSALYHSKEEGRDRVSFAP